MRIESLRPGDYKETAKVYAEVFAGHPWYEVTRCDTCHDFFGPNTSIGQACPKDGTPLGAAYPLEETTDYISEELRNPNGVGFALKDESDRIHGFGWGYSIHEPEKYAAHKYHKPETIEQVTGTLRANGITDEFYYVSEVGVVSEERVHGFGRQMTANLLAVADVLQQPTVLRTNEDSPMARIARRLEMKAIMGEGTDIFDSENAARMIFARRPKSIL